MQTHSTRQAILHGFLTGTLSKCWIPHEEEPATPFKDGTGHGQRFLRKDVVTDHGNFFREQKKNGFKSSSLLFDVTVANP